jgi:hypothetical protein
MNQWIYLGRARYGLANGDRFREALESIETARKRASIVVPVADMNALETAQRTDPGSRRRTAELMVDLNARSCFQMSPAARCSAI